MAALNCWSFWCRGNSLNDEFQSKQTKRSSHVSCSLCAKALFFLCEDSGRSRKRCKTRCWILSRSGCLMGMESLEDKLSCLDCEPRNEYLKEVTSFVMWRMCWSRKPQWERFDHVCGPIATESSCRKKYSSLLRMTWLLQMFQNYFMKNKSDTWSCNHQWLWTE